MNSKRCSSCAEVKDVGHFYKNRTRNDGYSHECKICKDKVRDAHRKTPRGREQRRSINRMNRQLYPDRVLAYSTINDAIHKGIFIAVATLRCIKCTKKAKIWHHHLGYDKDNIFNVLPVCRKCHYLIHKTKMSESLKG